MMILATELQQLKFGELMQVYEEGNRENGQALYPKCEPNVQLLQAEQDFYAYLRDGFFNRPGDRYCIWEAQGHYVCALRLQRYQDGLLLEALETHPEHRGRGFAKALIREALKLAETDKVYSHISRRNPASIAVHMESGFRKILDYSLYADGTTNSCCDTYLYEKPRCD